MPFLYSRPFALFAGKLSLENLMNIDMLRHFFVWCAIVNYAMLMLWFVLHLSLHGVFIKLGVRFFNMPAEKYDAVTLKGMLFLKLVIWAFNITPYLVLRFFVHS